MTNLLLAITAILLLALLHSIRIRRYDPKPFSHKKIDELEVTGRIERKLFNGEI